MQSTSQVWKDLFAAGAPLQARAVIAGTVYGEISAPVIRRAAMQDALSVGNVAAASLALTVRGAGSIPRSAAVAIETRLNDGQTASEWLPQGTFYVSRRARDPVTGLLALECYDALLKANALWTPSAGSWPRSMAAVTEELAALLGLEIDSRTQVPEGAEYVVAEPVAGTTVRDALGRIAQAAGGSWIVTPGNRLRLVTLDGAGDALEVAGVVGGIDAGAAGTVTGVRCTVDGVAALIGDDTGIVVDVTVAPVIAADMARRLIGLPYQPFRLAGAVYDPAAELGDAVRAGAAGEVASALWDERVCLGPAVRGEIAAPEAGELTDEYPYIGSASRTLALAKAAVSEAVEQYDDSLTQQEIFNRLTDNGAAQGLALYNGELYINASYINAGTLNVGLINFNSYESPYEVPDEYDSSSMLYGEHVEDGWIVSDRRNERGWGDITIIRCDGAEQLRGQTIIITMTTRATISEQGYWLAYIDEHGDEQFETGVTMAPAYGSEDAQGNLNGAIDDGEYERYSMKYHVPSNATYFSLSVYSTGIRNIVVSDQYSQNFGLRYGNNIGLNYKGLQVGKFVVDRSGNVTSNGDNLFTGDARFTGDVSLDTPLPVASGGTGAADAAGARASLDITPANIGALPASTTFVSGVKGNAESSYRSGNVNLTPANIGALPASTTFVSGVKGNAESSYRSGNVNLTPANIGAVNRAGDTMTGAFTLKGGQYGGPGGAYGMNANNSDIVFVNGIYHNDSADDFSEGHLFYRSSTTWDAMAANGGTFYFGSNVARDAGLTGNATLKAGRLILTASQDAAGASANAVALIVGGEQTGAHLEFDGNEIMAKANGTSTGTLYLNSDGGEVHIGSGGLTIGKALGVAYGGTGATAAGWTALGNLGLKHVAASLTFSSGHADYTFSANAYVIGYNVVNSTQQITMYRASGYTRYRFTHVSNSSYSGTISMDIYYINA